MRRLDHRWAVGPPLAVVGTLFGGALLGAFRASLSPEIGADPTLDIWRAVLTHSAFRDALLFSARIAVVATLLSAVVAVGAAFLLRGRGLVPQGMFSLPVLVPHLAVAAVAVFWLGPGGLADRLLGGLPIHLVRDRGGWGVILVYLYKEVPFLVLLVLAAWGRGVAEREEAAAVLGAGPWMRFRLVVWPAIRAPVAIGSVIVAAFVFGSFEVPILVGPNHPPILAVLALQATQTPFLAGRAEAAVILLVAAAGSVLLALAAAPWVRRMGA